MLQNQKKKATIKSLYIHFPFCFSKCNYCGFYSVTEANTDLNTNSNIYANTTDAKNHILVSKEESLFKRNYHVEGINNQTYENYLMSLNKEFLFYFENYDFSKLETIYIGGGNPSLNCDFILDIFTFLKNYLKIEKLKEFTVECNPVNINEKFLINCKNSGISRLSIGIQSFCNEALIFANRKQPPFEELVLIFKKIEKKLPEVIVSIDLINGLPHSNINEEVEKLDFLLTIFQNIKHISIYDLTIDEGSFFHKNNIIPQSDEKKEKNEKEYKKVLKKHNFKQYEVSNYCKNKHFSYHNMNYWKYNNYIGLGPSAHSTVDGIRIENKLDIINYLDFKKIEEICHIFHLTKKEQIEEFILMGFRLKKGLSIVDFKKRYNCDFLQYFSIPINNHKKNKNLTVSKNYVKLTSKGMKILNQILIDFFSYIDYVENM